MRKNKNIAGVEVVETGRRGRKFLVPLATLAAAGALAVGSGADFISTSANPASAVAAGTLKHLNSKDGKAVFNVSNIKPGDTVNGDVQITNNGSLPELMTLTQTGVSNGFSAGALQLKVVDLANPSVAIYNGNFESLPSTGLGRYAPTDSKTYRFTVTFVKTAGDQNVDQGKTASATFNFTGNQTAAANSDSGFNDAGTGTPVTIVHP